MKLKEFSIIRYGPLENLNKIKLNDFNLIWGKNECGKTLTIDGLVKLLFNKTGKDFENLERVQEVPEGYVVLVDEKGNEYKIPEKGDLPKISGLSATECNNIFIVRNSNLSVAHDLSKESMFYESITDKLTGLETERIAKISEKIKEIARLTDKSLEFQDVKDEKLKTRINEANKLIEEIDQLIQEVKEKGLDELEEKKVELKEQLETIEEEIKKLEALRKREKYEKGDEALTILKKLMDEIKELDVYNENDAKLWNDLEKELDMYSSQKQKKEKELEVKVKELEKADEKYKELSEEFKSYEEKKKKIDEEIKPEMSRFNSSRDVNKLEKKNKVFTVSMIISIVILAISVVGIVFNKSLLFYVLTAVSSIAVAAFGGLKYKVIKDQDQVINKFEEFKAKLQTLGLMADTLGEIYENIKNYEVWYETKLKEFNRAFLDKEKIKLQINDLKNKEIAEIEQHIKNIQEKIEKLKEKSKETSLESYNEKLKLKNEIKNNIGKQETILKSHFGYVGKSLEEAIPYWENEIKKLEIYKDNFPEDKFSEDLLTNLKNNENKYKNEYEEVHNNTKLIQKMFEDIEGRVNKILLPEEHLFCETSTDLEAIKKLLSDFVNTHENNRNNALVVLSIFEELEREEKGKISSLFGQNSLVTKYFKEITDGLYDEVTFDSNENKIKVRRKDKVVLDAYQLSGGAYDQLYFSIRLALGRTLLKDRFGFFIMDDPFVKSDFERLNRQMNLLKKIANSGWQIIYFSSKDEIKDLLKEEIANKTINYVELSPLFS
ncbi:MAG TPA: AAA family ATPase [Defluviitoga tunisiensis]|jgi:exonuclease SbcC|nr:AAA family ATPase [Defluviitoga tunisiensis]HHV02094.1 AAA family ATPase [Defluviitoga tunisiensis]HOK16802.1 AAA family ATPase [Defluviitoga tunisiensis]HOL86994.1 AAA family ATPase [Defluviitoga tunisiensis]HPP10721.1 AAA family ATPase [Defluviitoga tunisiensis]